MKHDEIKGKLESARMPKPVGKADNREVQGIVIGPAQKICTRIARLLIMQSNQTLSERKSWSNLAINFLRGVCDVKTSNGVTRLFAEDILNIPANELHEITSITYFRAVVSFDASQNFEKFEFSQ